MNEPTHSQVVAALLAYDLAIDGVDPSFPQRLESMRAALAAALSAREPAVAALASKAFAFDEWIEKTNWVQEQLSTFPPGALGMHRADILRAEIERLRAQLAARESVLGPRVVDQWVVGEHEPQRLTVPAGVGPTERPEGARCRTDGRCQQAIDYGTEGLAVCPPGKCCMPRPDVCAEMRALCANCGGTGDVTRADGVWLGKCKCGARRAE